jgi:hypothetical protein
MSVIPTHKIADFLSQIYLRGVSGSSWTAIVSASVIEDERRGQGHTSTSLLHQSAT